MTRTSQFEANPNRYDAWFDDHPESYQAELAAVRAAIPVNGVGVEIGVGTGRFASPLGISVGVEPSPQMAALARGRGIEVAEGVAESLPFANSSFDFAIMVTVVCFLDDIPRAFEEAWRILKPDGALVVGFIDRESELGRLYSHKKERSAFYRDARFYSAGELAVLLTNAGFSALSYRQTLLPGETTHLTVREGSGSGGFVVIKAHKEITGDRLGGRDRPLSAD